MPVLGPHGFALEIPSLEDGIRFYTDAGLDVAVEADSARLRCPGQDRDCITLLGGHDRKRLHHVALRADGLDAIAIDIPAHGGRIVPAPASFEDDGLWVEDPHGMLIHLVERPEERAPTAGAPFEINAPGRLVRKGRPASLPLSKLQPIHPLRLGHIVAFSPDVAASVAFVTGALGMGLADRSEDIVAFCCARRNSDHHVLAFAKSGGIGFHHASFMVADPDEVGRAGRALAEKSKRGDWGFGRHTIGSNFFHYIQDPWGSWFEYYSDMDHIEDYSRWTPSNYAPEDSLANWGPRLPDDFICNRELESTIA